MIDTPAVAQSYAGSAEMEVAVAVLTEHRGVIYRGGVAVRPGRDVVWDEDLVGSGWAAGGLADPAGLDSFGSAFVGFQGPFGVAGLHHPVAQAEDVAGEVAVAQPPADRPTGRR